MSEVEKKYGKGTESELIRTCGCGQCCLGDWLREETSAADVG